MKEDDFLLLVIGGLTIIAIAITYPHVEYMTNKDLVSALQTHGTADPKKKKSKDQPSEMEIYGPKAPKVVPSAPSGLKNGSDSGGVYPDIYGPDIVKTPGTSTKQKEKGKHTSDDVDDETYDFNPDLQKAFPTEGEPQPFLTDFAPFKQ
jgi:hypothetical protein